MKKTIDNKPKGGVDTIRKGPLRWSEEMCNLSNRCLLLFESLHCLFTVFFVCFFPNIFRCKVFDRIKIFVVRFLSES